MTAAAKEHAKTQIEKKKSAALHRSSVADPSSANTGTVSKKGRVRYALHFAEIRIIRTVA